MPLSESELVEVRKVFDKFDVKKLGSIDASEITNAARSLNVSPGPRPPAQTEGILNFEDFCKVRLRSHPTPTANFAPVQACIYLS